MTKKQTAKWVMMGDKRIHHERGDERLWLAFINGTIGPNGGISVVNEDLGVYSLEHSRKVVHPAVPYPGLPHCQSLLEMELSSLTKHRRCAAVMLIRRCQTDLIRVCNAITHFRLPRKLQKSHFPGYDTEKEYAIAQDLFDKYISLVRYSFDFRNCEAVVANESSFAGLVFHSLAEDIATQPDNFYIRQCPWSKLWFVTADSRKIYANAGAQEEINKVKRRKRGLP